MKEVTDLKIKKISNFKTQYINRSNFLGDFKLHWQVISEF